MVLPVVITDGVRAVLTKVSTNGGPWRPLASLRMVGGTAGPPPLEPNELALGQVAATAVEVAWTPPTTGTVTAYSLVVRQGTSSGTVVQTIPLASTALTRTVTGLTASTAYTFVLTATVSGSPVAYNNVTATTSGGSGTTTRLLGIYSGDAGEKANTHFGRWPDCLTNYYQHGGIAGMRSWSATVIGRGITPIQTVSFKDYLNAAGSAGVDGTRPNAYSIVAAGRAADPTAYDAVVTIIDNWAKAFQAVATAQATIDAGVTIYACLDSEPDAKTNAANANGLVINATTAEMGKFFNVGSQRFRLHAPDVKYGVWFAQSRKTQILEMLAQMAAGSVDWLSADPYTNGAVSAGATTETWQACVSSKWTTWIRTETTGQWKRLGSPPLAVTEFGISNGAGWNYGAGTRDHTDAQIATYYTNLRAKMALPTVDVFAAVLFDRERDKDHEITGPAAPFSPLAIAAFKASLESAP